MLLLIGSIEIQNSKFKIQNGSIPLVHFSFKALILWVQSTRKISAFSPFVRVAWG
jgi:hypothetical protein